jgi:MoaA/NifB/PqqE/SkfB family radical SAM enzyme/SAM-dependent methyltransferase
MAITFDPKLWTRLRFEGLPIYIRPERPDWLVPNRAGDSLLQKLMAGERPEMAAAERRFLQRLPDAAPLDYPGRNAFLRTDRLRELWFHITDSCNMGCRHCLVSSSPRKKKMLSAARILELARQAAEAGCRLFALTGGEPLYHPEFDAIVDGLLALGDSHVAVLTNGSLLTRHREGLARWPGDRFHLQLSVDGLDGNHDRLRGAGAFERLRGDLAFIKEHRFPYTLSMCVMRSNLEEMPGMIDFAAESGAANVHFLWYFIRGRGNPRDFAEPERIFPHLREATARAAEIGLGIDNIDSFRTRVFAPAGTIHDGGNSGWESVAVGADGNIYPSPALVGVDDLGTPLDGGLVNSWRESPVLQRLRDTTVKGSDSPLRLIVGGGDPDHSFIHAGEFSGLDPYLPLHEQVALWLISEEAAKRSDEGPPGLRLKMGDILEQCGDGGGVELVHSNCLLALASRDHVTAVKDFYSGAVSAPQSDILNPVFYPDEHVAHIPKECLVRSYGCGSPVLDAGLREGERVVDLGSGTGVECLIASKLVGENGGVTGIDMLDPMLEIAREGAGAVAGTLGYSNVRFEKGYLESLPLPDDSADVMISNCVLNLSGDKRSTFAETARVLAEGGRLVVSDVVCESEPPASIRNDSTLKGECIAGALTQKDLAGLLAESGYTALKVIRRFPYREVQGHQFYSLTFEARKPPAASDGIDQFFELKDDTVIDIGEAGTSCCSSIQPQEGASCCSPPPKQGSGCMLCGEPLDYFSEQREAECVYCGKAYHVSALCKNGHYVCDGCHAEDALTVIEHVCTTTSETDVIKLLDELHSHKKVPMHGPEHHALVPGVILAAYRNLGGAISDDDIRTGIKRGSVIPGGFCGYAGNCGAAVGVGIAFSLILESNPLKTSERAAALTATATVLERISRLEAARCCQRESFIALTSAIELSESMLPIPLRSDAALICRQSRRNEECIKALCPVVKSSKPAK